MAARWKREQAATRRVFLLQATEEENMPAFLILWAVPAVIVIGGVGYYLVRAVN